MESCVYKFPPSLPTKHDPSPLKDTDDVSHIGGDPTSGLTKASKELVKAETQRPDWRDVIREWRREQEKRANATTHVTKPSLSAHHPATPPKLPVPHMDARKLAMEVEKMEEAKKALVKQQERTKQEQDNLELPRKLLQLEWQETLNKDKTPGKGTGNWEKPVSCPTFNPHGID